MYIRKKLFYACGESILFLANIYNHRDLYSAIKI